MRYLVLMFLFTVSSCTPIWTGNRMQDEIQALREDQAILNQNLVKKEQELTEMIANARSETDNLNKILDDATSLLQRNSADFGVEIQTLQKNVEKIRGRSEELQFTLEKLQQELKLFKEDTDIRFSESAKTPPQSPTDLFNEGKSRFEQKEYKDARKLFESYTLKYPKRKSAAEAYFLVGESFYHQGQYVSAVGAYENILKSYSASSFADDATYRIGDAFSKLKKCKEAVIFYDSVVEDYKKSKFRKKAKAKLKKAKAGKC